MKYNEKTEKDFWSIVEKIYGSKLDKSKIVSLEDNLGFSSFQLVQLIVEIEDFFGVTMPIDKLEFKVLNYPEKLLEFIKSNLNENNY